MKAPLIYIAGPFRAPTPWEIEQNIRRAEEFGLAVAKAGGIPVIPHAMYRFFQDSLPDEFWLQAGLEILQPCHAVAVCVSRERSLQSLGTCGEIGSAVNQGIPVFYTTDVPLLTEWIHQFKKGLPP